MKIYCPAIIIGIAVTLCLMIGYISFCEEVTWHNIEFFLQMTGQIMLPFFLLSFGASALNHYFSSKLTAIVLRNRRHLGIGFGIIFLIHLGGIFAKFMFFPEKFFDELEWQQLVFGTTAFLFGLAMLFTSSNKATRILGMKAWRTLHLFGGYYLLSIIWLTYFDDDLRENVKNLLIFLGINVILLLRICRDGQIIIQGKKLIT